MSIAVIHHFATTARRVAAIREAGKIFQLFGIFEFAFIDFFIINLFVCLFHEARIVRSGGRLLFTAWAWEQEKFKNEPVSYNTVDDDILSIFL